MATEDKTTVEKPVLEEPSETDQLGEVGKEAEVESKTETPAPADAAVVDSSLPVAGDKALPQWREKAGVVINQSSIKFKEAATIASAAVAGAAEVTHTKVKVTWENTKESWQTTVQPRVTATWQSTKEGWETNVKPKVEAAAKAAAEAGAIIKKSILETKDRVASAALHKKVAEATRNSLERSRTFLVRMEILPPEMNPRAVFGVPFEKVVSYQPSDRPIPHIVVSCVEFIESQGLHTEFLFDDEGDPTFVTKIMKSYERDDQASVPAGVRPQDVAQVLLAFFRCLPEPILTFQLYEEVVSASKEAGEEAETVSRLQEVLGKLPAANHSTLVRVFSLLSKVASEEASGKMNAAALAREWAPVLLWKKGGAPATVSPGILPKPSEGTQSETEPVAEVESGESTPKGSSVSTAAIDDQKAISAAVQVLITRFEEIFIAEDKKEA